VSPARMLVYRRMDWFAEHRDPSVALVDPLANQRPAGRCGQVIKADSTDHRVAGLVFSPPQPSAFQRHADDAQLLAQQRSLSTKARRICFGLPHPHLPLLSSFPSSDAHTTWTSAPRHASTGIFFARITPIRRSRELTCPDFCSLRSKSDMVRKELQAAGHLFSALSQGSAQ